MPTINHFQQGMPCWFELGTTDQEAAKSPQVNTRPQRANHGSESHREPQPNVQ